MGTLNERSSEFRLKRQKLKRRILIIIGIVVLVFLAAGITYYIWNQLRTKQFTSYEEENSFDRADSNTVKYLPYNGNILKYSRDGASALDSDGNSLWNGSFEMSNPMIDICQSFVVAADQGGKEVYVYNGSDSGTMLTMPLPVSMVRVASQGVVAVVMEDTGSNVVALYDPYGSSDKLLAEVPTNVTTDGYPVDIAISPDGKSLVTSYLAVKGGSTESNVCFYNFSDVGKDSNRIVGGKAYSDSMAVKLEFIDENTLCVFLDNGFSLFTNMKKPEEKYSEVFEEEIRSTVFDEDYVGFVFAEGGDESNYKIKLYNMSGKAVLDKAVDYDYESVYMMDNEIIFYSNMGCEILRTNGSEKFKYSFDTAMKYFIKSGEKDRYFIIDNSRITKVELTEG